MIGSQPNMKNGMKNQSFMYDMLLDMPCS